MSEEEKQAIIKRGANARAHGLHSADNPYLKSENMPRATGETIEQWQEKQELWDLGWKLEDAVR